MLYTGFSDIETQDFDDSEGKLLIKGTKSAKKMASASLKSKKRSIVTVNGDDEEAAEGNSAKGIKLFFPEQKKWCFTTSISCSQRF